MPYLFPIPGCFSMQTSTFVQGKCVTPCLKIMMFDRAYKPYDRFKQIFTLQEILADPLQSWR